MANANVARGLIPYRHFDGSVWNGSANMYYVHSTYASSLFIGDPVDVNSAMNDSSGIPAVQLAVTNAPILGVVVGIVAGGNPTIAVTRDQAIYHPSSTGQYILVADDPTLLFLIQDDASTQGTAPNLWANKNAGLIPAAGSTTTGYSGWQLKASTVATSSALDLKIMRPLDQSDNAIGTAANTNMNAKWLVKLNNLRLANAIAGV